MGWVFRSLALVSFILFRLKVFFDLGNAVGSDFWLKKVDLICARLMWIVVTQLLYQQFLCMTLWEALIWDVDTASFVVGCIIRCFERLC